MKSDRFLPSASAARSISARCLRFARRLIVTSRPCRSSSPVVRIGGSPCPYIHYTSLCVRCPYNLAAELRDSARATHACSRARSWCSERLPELEIYEPPLLVAEADVDARHERRRQGNAKPAAVAVAEGARDAADDGVVQPEFAPELVVADEDAACFGEGHAVETDVPPVEEVELRDLEDGAPAARRAYHVVPRHRDRREADGIHVAAVDPREIVKGVRGERPVVVADALPDAHVSDAPTRIEGEVRAWPPADREERL